MESLVFDPLDSHLILFLVLALITVLICISCKRKHVYLIDFICYQAPEGLRVPVASFFEHIEIMRRFNPEEIEFQRKVVERSGIGNETYFPLGVQKIPPDQSISSAMEEAQLVLFSIVQTLLTKHNVNPKSIDILITNCGLYCPTPSLAAMIINKFGFRSNVKSFNLSGMGCSAGILAVSLAKDLLKVHKNSLALVLSSEAISPAAYSGSVDRSKAKYELQHIVRTHLAAKDSAYNCIIQQVDDEGHTGVSLSRNVVHVAGEALQINMATLGPLVLPYSELILYAMDMLWRKLWPQSKKGPYIPNFKKAFDHFCVHAGGKAVIEAVKQHLKLADSDVEASKMTLYRYGNTSSSSTCEREGEEGGIKFGKIAFGSGFKCNSAVWKCISELRPDGANAWSDRIHRYPVNVPQVALH
ncbi:hypothetical protein Ancab_000708 [Ancistrocladus abbreviatus]